MGRAEVTAGLEEAVAYEVADKAIPSISYAVFDRRQVLVQRHEAASGAPPLSDDTLFRVGSISKTYCALAAMRLVTQGRLDLDADIGPLLGGLQPADPFHECALPLTLRKLLGHRSGLTREAAIGNYLDSSEPPLAATVESLRGTRYKVDPSGHVYRYSNAGFAIIGAAIEAVSGESYDAHLARHVLAPLGFADTHVHLKAAQIRRLAPARMWTEGRDLPAPVFNMGSAPAGNIAATLGDVARYGQLLLGGGELLLRADTLAAMWGVPDGKPAGYGLGFAVGILAGQRCIGHGGVVYGYASQLLMLPEAGIGVVMLSTLDATNDVVDRLARYALRLVLADRSGSDRPRAPRRLPRPDPAVSRSWAGTYAADDGTGLSLVLRGERLLLVHDTVSMELRPLDAGHLVLDGRLYGEGTSYAHAMLELRDADALGWCGRVWRRVARPEEPVPPPDLAPHLGSYGPACLDSRLLWAGRLVCVMEQFFPHECMPLGGHRYRLGPGMYEDEIVELGVRAAAGRPAIRVGDMLLARG